MRYCINDTKTYHLKEIKSLGWELTVCNTLEPQDSPIRSILKYNDTYGNQLYRYLEKYLKFHTIGNIIEIGGGYGFLMRDFLIKNHNLKAAMIEISHYLLRKQKDLLNTFEINFIHDDFFQLSSDFLKNFDLAVLNENTGDFPTITNADSDIVWSPLAELDSVELNIRRFFDVYSLTKPERNRSFNFNIGAATALEKLCLAGVPNIFISEHSCEAKAPEQYMEILGIYPSEYPEKIQLMGHDEYTVKFSFLEIIGKYFNYKIIRGPLIDIIEVGDSEKLDPIIFSGIQSERMEILKQFVYDLYKYEFILLFK